MTTPEAVTALADRVERDLARSRSHPSPEQKGFEQ